MSYVNCIYDAVDDLVTTGYEMFIKAFDDDKYKDIRDFIIESMNVYDEDVTYEEFVTSRVKKFIFICNLLGETYWLGDNITSIYNSLVKWYNEEIGDNDNE